MDDNEFIYKFLNKNYTLSFDEKNLGGLCILDKFTNQKIKLLKFEYTIDSILGDWLIDDVKSKNDLYLKWIEEQTKIVFDVIIDYLDGLNIELEFDTWVVKTADGTKITDDFIINKFSDRYDKSLVANYYGTWYYDKVCEATEKIMKTW